MEEEVFYDIIYSEKDSNYEENEIYEDIDDARADFISMTQTDKEFYDYVVLREITIIDDEEDIEEIDCYYKEN